MPNPAFRSALRSLSRWLGRPNTRTSRGKARRPWRAVEQLEDRSVPATFVVNTTADTIDTLPGDGLAADGSGKTSLRAAVMEANALAGADAIQLPSGVYTLTLAGFGENAARTGDLDITGPLTVAGSGRDTTVVNGGSLDRVFHVLGTPAAAAPVVSITGVTITGGQTPQGFESGGGVLNERGDLTLGKVSVVGNKTGPGFFGGYGGGVYSVLGTLNIFDSLVAKNATGDGSRVGGQGGGVGMSSSVVTIARSEVRDNRTGNGEFGSNLVTAGDGGGVYGENANLGAVGVLTITDSVIAGNATGASKGEGGGIEFGANVELVLENSVVSNNTAYEGGGITVGNGTVRRIVNSTIADNTADGGNGGGIHNEVGVIELISRTTISGNKALNTRGSFSGGGGISSQGKIGTIENSTISGNVATRDPADTLDAGVGGGIANNNHIDRIVNTTIAGNTARNGGGLYHAKFANFDPVLGDLRNTVIGDNTATDTLHEDFVQLGTVTTAVFNLIETRSGHPIVNGVNGNIVGFDPALGPLALNGGPTRTHALLPGSPAIDKGTATNAPATDQRGQPRPAGLGFDIGAFELQPSGNRPPVIDDQKFATDEDVALQGQLAATDADGDKLTYTRVAPAKNGFAGVRPDGSFVYIPNFNYFGPDSFVVQVSDGKGGTDTAVISITVNPVNDAPFVDNPVVTSPEDTAVTRQIDFFEAEGEPVTFAVKTNPANGVVTLTAGGEFTYTPNADFNGIDKFTFTASDNKGASRDGAVTIHVTPVNDAPVADGDAYGTDEDTAITITAAPASRLVMVSEPGDFIGGGLSYDFSAPPSTFTASKNFDNGVSVRVTPPGQNWSLDFAAPNEAVLTPGYFPGATRFPFQKAGEPGLWVAGNGRGYNMITGEFTAQDVGFGAGSAVDSFAASFVQQGKDFDGSVDPPLRGTILFNTAIGTKAGVLANDTDVDGDLILTAVLVSGPSNGTLALNRDGTFTYTPNPNFHGTDTFTYRTSDGRLQSGVATVTITVRPVNDAPQAKDDSYSTNEDAALTVAAPGVLGNDVDIDGDTLSAVLVTGPTRGALALNADGSFTYTPNPNYNGPDGFTYKARDAAGAESQATVSLTVVAVNDPPVAGDDAATTAEDTAVTVAVLGNDTDVDGDALSVSAVTQGANGKVGVNPDGTITYTPNPNFHGTDTFEYTASDGKGGTDTGLVTVRVTPVNDAPVANPDGYVTGEDTKLTVAAPGVLGNDTDIDGDALSAVLVTGPTHGTLSFTADGSFVYTPDANYNGPDGFTYKAQDGKGGEAVAAVSLKVAPVNDPPVANPDAYTTDEDVELRVAAPGVLGNDTDVEGDALTAALASDPANGIARVNADGSFTYIPFGDFHGTDKFTYTVRDGNGGTATGTVTVTVNSVNDPPVANDDIAQTAEDTPVRIDVLANDGDADGDTLTVTAVTPGANGTVLVNTDGTVSYTPNANFHGGDTFGYTISDGKGGTSSTTVFVLVTPVNDPPVARPGSATTAEDKAVSGRLAATDVDGDALTYRLVAGPSRGAVTVNPDGTFTYAPAANFHGTDSFTFRANDGSADSNVAAVTITVTPVNDAPAADDDAYDVTAGGALAVGAPGVLANDRDVDGDALRAELVSLPANGTLTFNANGSFTYTPRAGFTGTDTFVYRATDGAAADTAVVTIRVAPAAESTDGKVTGSGAVDRGKRLFAFSVQSKKEKKTERSIHGLLAYTDLQRDIVLVGTQFTSFRVEADGVRASFSGTGWVNGRAGYAFTVTIADRGEPGVGRDTFRIRITGPNGFSYDSADFAANGGRLDAGNIQVHKDKDKD